MPMVPAGFGDPSSFQSRRWPVGDFDLRAGPGEETLLALVDYRVAKRATRGRMQLRAEGIRQGRHGRVGSCNR
jgi:hypothetical protein